jgi:putative ABC transport system substrate-binding protein
MLARALRSAASGLVVMLVLASVACGGRTSGQEQPFVIGLVTNNPNGLRNIQGFRDGMAELGYVEGDTVRYLFEGSRTSEDRLDAVLGDMVAAQVDLIFTAGTPTGVAAHRATESTDVPVVFGVIADPIAAGVMDDLTHPGGNMTGVRISENQARRLELLLQVAPGTRRVFVPYDPTDAASSSAVAQVQEMAPELDVEIVEGKAFDDGQVTELLASVPTGIDAILLVPSSRINSRLAEVLAVALDRGLPVSGPSTAQVEEGALMAYGFIHTEAGAQAARIADEVLRGANPGDLPVETAESYLAINLAMADAIGLQVPYEVLLQAEVIIRAGDTG